MQHALAVAHHNAATHGTVSAATQHHNAATSLRGRWRGDEFHIIARAISGTVSAATRTITPPTAVPLTPRRAAVPPATHGAVGAATHHSAGNAAWGRQPFCAPACRLRRQSGWWLLVMPDGGGHPSVGYSRAGSGGGRPSGGSPLCGRRSRRRRPISARLSSRESDSIAQVLHRMAGRALKASSRKCYNCGNIRALSGGTFTLARDLSVTRIGYGAMQLACPHVFGPPPDQVAAVAVLREAIELGITHIDTS